MICISDKDCGRAPPSSSVKAGAIVMGIKKTCDSGHTNIASHSTVPLNATLVLEWKLTDRSPQMGHNNFFDDIVSGLSA
jgi:hypothetical protein